MPDLQQISAPWTQEQVDALNKNQREGDFHPFTCGNDRSSEAHRRYADEHGDPDWGLLVATESGWRCPVPGCGYTQTWALDFMFKPVVSMRDRLSDWLAPVKTVRSGEITGQVLAEGDLRIRLVSGSSGSRDRSYFIPRENIGDLITVLAQLLPDLGQQLLPLDKRCADAMADEIDVLVRRKVIDSRSPAADALVDYRTFPNAPSTERSDRLLLFYGLLARIHRDGGHYMDQHGVEKATDDADRKVAEWIARDP